MQSIKRIEDAERSCIRLVSRALRDYRDKAVEIFREESDKPGNIAEDVTREAMDALGTSRVPIRLYGKVDDKRAAIVFLSDREVEVAMMVDPKAEKDGNTATIQMSQTSMQIRQYRQGEEICVNGTLPPFIEREGKKLQTITIIVKYIYTEITTQKFILEKIKVACIPNGLLQESYNPNAQDGFWRVGRNAPSLGEDFRVRLSFSDLQKKQNGE